jgi:integrase
LLLAITFALPSPNRIQIRSNWRGQVRGIKSAWEAAWRRTRYHCPGCRSGRLASRAAGYACDACGLLLAAGAEGIRFHYLRHTAVSRMIVAGVPLPVIAKVVG